MFNTKKITVLIVCAMCIATAIAFYKINTNDDYLEGGDIQKSINTQQN
jgi:hypothetical protein